MSLFIASLNSGSNGNCYYIGNDDDAILVDAGISCREIERRMQQLSLNIERLRAVLITHEHIDHISGLPGFVKKYRLPVYITNNTYRATGYSLDTSLVRTFVSLQPFTLGSLSVTAFPKRHDAVDPHSVVITGNGVTAGVFTDIGSACANVVNYFRQCHAVFLETNYDEEMLANGRYPVFLRNRISGRHGHLSNLQALELFTTHRPAFMTHVLLSHLSSENNHPSVAANLFNAHAGGVTIVHAPRDKATAVYHIQASVVYPAALPQPARATRKKAVPPQVQLSLF